jgi:hypothetical protein
MWNMPLIFVSNSTNEHVAVFHSNFLHTPSHSTFTHIFLPLSGTLAAVMLLELIGFAG